MPEIYSIVNGATKLQRTTNIAASLPDIYMTVYVGVLVRTQMLPG
jgi:hypothetical protein